MFGRYRSSHMIRLADILRARFPARAELGLCAVTFVGVAGGSLLLRNHHSSVITPMYLPALYVVVVLGWSAVGTSALACAPWIVRRIVSSMRRRGWSWAVPVGGAAALAAWATVATFRRMHIEAVFEASLWLLGIMLGLAILDHRALPALERQAADGSRPAAAFLEWFHRSPREQLPWVAPLMRAVALCAATAVVATLAAVGAAAIMARLGGGRLTWN